MEVIIESAVRFMADTRSEDYIMERSPDSNLGSIGAPRGSGTTSDGNSGIDVPSQIIRL